MQRVRYLDLLRPVAIGAVVYGHWLLICLTYSHGRFSDLDTLGYVDWGRWLTWAFQVMPVFFLVGGYANALSWAAHHAQGERWNWWIQRRAMRLWWPTAVYLGVNALVIVVARAAGMAAANIALAGVQRLNNAVMTVYLWHFVPVLVIAAAFYPTGVMPQPAIGSAQWWELRPAWLGLLTVVLALMIIFIMWAERPMRRLPAGIGPPEPWSPGLLLVGLAATLAGLSRLTIAGFAPGGHLSWLTLADCAVGLAATLCSGRDPAAGAKPKALSPQQPPKAA